MTKRLQVNNHDRDIVGLTYVYPVISRRAGGVSLGINLSPNNACNWQCIYCQVPNLTKGVSPRVDLEVLHAELDSFLNTMIHGDYLEKHVPQACREFKDLAISGNGEPTTCPNFFAAVVLIANLMDKYQLNIPLRLITNGSSVHKVGVQQGLELMNKHQGEVWFKVDTVGEQQTQSINGVAIKPSWQLKQLETVSEVCRVKLQTCVLKEQSQNEAYMDDYLSWVQHALEQGVCLEGVLLYGLARPSMQLGGDTLQSADKVWMKGFAEKIESLGLSVTVS